MGIILNDVILMKVFVINFILLITVGMMDKWYFESFIEKKMLFLAEVWAHISLISIPILMIYLILKI